MDDLVEAHGEPLVTREAGHGSRYELHDLSTSTSAVARAPVLEPAARSSSGTAVQKLRDAAEMAVGDDDVVEEQLPTSGEVDNLQMVLAMNEAMSELLDDMIGKAEEALRVNLEKQRVLAERKKAFASNAAMVKRKVPVNLFMPPYFKDRFNMCPPQNAEMKRKMDRMIYDPLLREEKRWSDTDLETLHRAVRECLISQRLTTINAQRELLEEKVRSADITTTPAEREEWVTKMNALSRKALYERNRPDEVIMNGEYDSVDWATIAMQYFKGQRTPDALRLKWCNERAPQWAQTEWKAAEVRRLYDLATNNFVSWNVTAEKLGTRRTPWQCFEKFKSEISNEILKREWTQEEDERLVNLVESLQLNGVIQWDKVTYHMTGRTRQQCRTRFLRTLDKSIKHGRWTDEEDLLLMCSIGRYGAKDWRKIAKGVPGRNDGQCRERWVNVLDRANRHEEWTMEEDEKLLYAVNMFGKGQWSAISSVLPGRNQRTCKARFRSLLTTKMRICAAQLSKIRAASQKTAKRHVFHAKKGATFAEFNRLLGGNDESGKAFCDRARPEKNTPTTRFKTIDPEVTRVIQEGIQNIAKRYESGDGGVREDDHAELFAAIEEGGGGGAREREARMMGRAWLPVEFDESASEAERVKRLTEALCQVVNKQDQLVAVTTQEASQVRAERAVKEHLRRILEDAVEPRVAAALQLAARREEEERAGGRPGSSKMHSEAGFRREMAEAAAAAATAAADQLPPTAATAHAAEILMTELPRIAQLAAPMLSAVWGGEKVSTMEEMEARLRRALERDEEYLQLRELFRSLLVEPLKLVLSLEDDDRKTKFLTDEFNRMKEQLMADVEVGTVMDSQQKSVPKATPRRRSAAPPKSKAAAAIPTPKKQASRAKNGGGAQQKDAAAAEVAEEDEQREPRGDARPLNSVEVREREGEEEEEEEDLDEIPMDWQTTTPKQIIQRATEAAAAAAAGTTAAATDAAEEEAERPARSSRGRTPRRKSAAAAAAAIGAAARAADAKPDTDEEEAAAVAAAAMRVERKGTKRSRSRQSATPTSLEGVEEGEAVKAPAAKRTRSGSRSATQEDDEDGEGESEQAVIASQVKRGRGRPRKTPVRQTAEEAEEEGGEEEAVKQPRVTRSRSSSQKSVRSAADKEEDTVATSSKGKTTAEYEEIPEATVPMDTVGEHAEEKAPETTEPFE